MSCVVGRFRTLKENRKDPTSLQQWRVEKMAVSTIIKSHVLIDRTVKLIGDQTGLLSLMLSRAAMKIMKSFN